MQGWTVTKRHGVARKKSQKSSNPKVKPLRSNYKKVKPLRSKVQGKHSIDR